MVVFEKFIRIDGGGSVSGAEIKEVGLSGWRQYESEVMSILTAIAGNPVGKILLHWVRAVKGARDIAIYRYFRQNPHNKNDVNAASAASDPQAAVPRGQNVRDIHGDPVLVPVRDRQGNFIQDPVTGAVPLAPLMGTGGGTGAVIGFTPRMFTHQEVAGAAPDEALAHELVHTYRQLSGHITDTRTGLDYSVWVMVNGHPVQMWLGNYPNLEEFFAVLVANIYISARHRGEKLRTRYYCTIEDGKLRWRQAADSAARGPNGRNASEEFLLEYYGRITQLYNEETGFAHALAQVDATFNPFRDYEARLVPASRVTAPRR